MAALTDYLTPAEYYCFGACRRVPFRGGKRQQTLGAMVAGAARRILRDAVGLPQGVIAVNLSGDLPEELVFVGVQFLASMVDAAASAAKSPSHASLAKRLAGALGGQTLGSQGESDARSIVSGEISADLGSDPAKTSFTACSGAELVHGRSIVELSAMQHWVSGRIL